MRPRGRVWRPLPHAQPCRSFTRPCPGSRDKGPGSWQQMGKKLLAQKQTDVGSDRADFYQDIFQELQIRLLGKCSLQQHKMPACQDLALPLPRRSPLWASAPHPTPHPRPTRLCLSAL